MWPRPSLGRVCAWRRLIAMNERESAWSDGRNEQKRPGRRTLFVAVGAWLRQSKLAGGVGCKREWREKKGRKQE